MSPARATWPASTRRYIRSPQREVAAELRQATVAGALMMLLAAAPANAASPGAAVGTSPDSTQLALLRQQTAKPRDIRLRGSFGTHEITRPLFDTTGVSSAEWKEPSHRRPGLIVTEGAELLPTPQPIAWREISEIQTGHSMTGVGALAGFLIGTGGFAIPYLASQQHATEEEAFAAVSISLSVIVTTTAVGAIIGSRCGWRTIYRPIAPQQP
jgi:hypothetical protein